MKAETSGEKSVSVADLTDILIRSSRCGNRPGAALLPHIHVFLGIEGHHPLSGGTGSRMDPHTFFHVCPQKPMGIGIPEIIFG